MTLPIATDLTLQWQPGVAEGVAELSVLGTIATLGGIVLLPVGIGMMIRARWPQKAATAERAVSVLGSLILALLLITIVYSLGDEAWSMLVQAGLAAVLLSLAGTLVGILLAWAGRLPAGSWLAVGIELGQKKSTLGILIAATLLGSHALAVPAAVYGLVSFGPALLVIAYGRRQAARRQVQAATSSAVGA